MSQRYTEHQVAALNQIEHARDCKWFDDQDWGSATFANYVHNFGDYPACSCEAGRILLLDLSEEKP